MSERPRATVAFFCYIYRAVTGQMRSIRLSTKIIFAYLFFTQFMGAIYAAWESPPPTVVDLLSPLALAWLLWWWLRDDSKEYGRTWPLDLGMFVYAGWFLLLPYHLIKTRGAKGLIGIVAFVAVAWAAWICAAIFVVLVWY